MATMAILWAVDGFSLWRTLIGLGSHVVYLLNMRRFPYIKMSDPLFILACGECSVKVV